MSFSVIYNFGFCLFQEWSKLQREDISIELGMERVGEVTECDCNRLQPSSLHDEL